MSGKIEFPISYHRSLVVYRAKYDSSLSVKNYAGTKQEYYTKYASVIKH